MEPNGLHAADWIIFAIMLLLSISIGKFALLNEISFSAKQS